MLQFFLLIFSRCRFQYENLCLIVLWLEFISMLLIMKQVSLQNISDLIILFFGFTISMLIWFTIKPVITKAKQTEFLKETLHFYKKTQGVIECLINTVPLVSLKSLSNELIIGSEKAEDEIVLVSYPFCGSCKTTFNDLIQIQKQYPNNLKIKIRFYLNNAEHKDAINVISQILYTLINEVNEKATSKLIGFYQNQNSLLIEDTDRNFSGKSNIINNLFDSHLQWCSELNIHAAPTIFYNNRKLMEYITTSDLCLFLKSKYRNKIS